MCAGGASLYRITPATSLVFSCWCGALVETGGSTGELHDAPGLLSGSQLCQWRRSRLRQLAGRLSDARQGRPHRQSVLRAAVLYSAARPPRGPAAVCRHLRAARPRRRLQSRAEAHRLGVLGGPMCVCVLKSHSGP